MKIYVLCENYLKYGGIVLPDGFFWVSFNEPGRPDIQHHESFQPGTILRYNVYDLEEAKGPYDEIFLGGMAMQCASALYREHPNTVVCQCAAGVSRSAGMAAAIDKTFNGASYDEALYFGENSNYKPSKRIYELMLRCFHRLGL